jgi:sulfide:quinone oxidoreductase
VPPSPETSAALISAFDERDIRLISSTKVSALDLERRVAVLDDGGELPYDLFLGVPKHRAPDVVQQSGLTEDGYLPVDSATLATRIPGVYAIGDVATQGTPKAGVFAEGQAAVVAERIIAATHEEAGSSEYGGRGMCYLEFGDNQVAKVDVTFLTGQAPTGGLDGPSPAYVADKVEFGRSRVERWFGS